MNEILKALNELENEVQILRENGQNDLRNVLYEIKILKDKYKDYVPYVSEVEVFNTTFNKPNNFEPTIPEISQWKFVYDFILEELEEYKTACEEGDIVEILDALCDITYVSLGNGACLHGLKNKIPQAYAEVQRSNMSKACKTEQEAQDTVKYGEEKYGEPCHYEEKGDVFIVYRTRDRKVIKSINYSPANLEQFFTNDELNQFHNPKTII